MSAVDAFLEKKAAAESITKEAKRVPAIDPMAAVSMGEALSQMGSRDLAKFVAKGTLGTAALAAPVVGLSAAWEGGSRAVQAGVDAVSRALGFRRMVKANPELQEMDRTKVQQTYNTLHRFNPEMAADPLVSGSFVRSTAEYDNIPTRSVADLVSARSKMQRPGILDRASTFQPAATASMAPGMQLATAREGSKLQALGRADADTQTLKQRLEEARQMAGAQDKGRYGREGRVRDVVQEAAAQAQGKAVGESLAMEQKGVPAAIQEKSRLSEIGRGQAWDDPKTRAGIEDRTRALEAIKLMTKEQVAPTPDPLDLSYHQEVARRNAQEDFELGLTDYEPGKGAATPTHFRKHRGSK